MAERAWSCSLVPRSGEGRVTEGRRRGLCCRGGQRRNAPALHCCRRRGLTAGEEEGARVQPCAARVLLARVPWGRQRNSPVGQICLCVPESASTRLCRDRRVRKAGLERPTPALLKQNNVRFLPRFF